MKEQIISFIKNQTSASICCLDDSGNPYCFSCFYYFNSDDFVLAYKSSKTSSHSVFLLKNPAVAGTILPDKLNKFLVKGIQFEGFLLEEQHIVSKRTARDYYRQNPLALAIPGEIWTISINNIKMTDSSLGFGKKMKWNRDALVPLM